MSFILSLHRNSFIQTCIKLLLCTKPHPLPETLSCVWSKKKTKGNWELFQRQSDNVAHHRCPSVSSWAYYTLIFYLTAVYSSPALRQLVSCVLTIHWWTKLPWTCPHQACSLVRETALKQRGRRMDVSRNCGELCEDSIGVVWEKRESGRG